MGLQLTGGRDFAAHDKAGAPRVVVVNRSFVRRFLSGVAPIGAEVTTGDPDPGQAPRYQVVGIVEDAIYRSLRAPMEPTMYLPFAQEGASAVDHDRRAHRVELAGEPGPQRRGRNEREESDRGAVLPLA